MPPADPRARAVLDVLGGESVASVAARLGVASPVLMRWIASFVEAGSAAVVGVAADRAAPERFLTVLAHEVRTPLAAAIAGLHLLANPRLEAGSRAEIHLIISERLRQLSLLCGDVLDAASVALGTLTLELESVDLAEILVAARRERADSRLLDQSQQSLPIRADRRRVRQILLNMFDSALRLGSGPVQVVVHSSTDQVRIEVSCHAAAPVGSAEATSWFEPFDSPGASGHGLGLYVVRSLAVAHGGTAGVDSAACDEGGTNQHLLFWVCLPVTAMILDSRGRK